MNASELEAYFHQQIPLTRALELEVSELEPGRIHLCAPLAPNVNDKGTAFGGALSCMLTLAGWGLLHNETIALGKNVDIVIQKSEFLYNSPVKAALSVYCDLPDPEQWQRFLDCLDKRGRGRVVATSWVAGNRGAAVTMTGRYVAITRGSDQ